MEKQRIVLEIDLEGTEKVVSRFREVSSAASTASKEISQNYMQLGNEAARLGLNIFQLTDNLERFSKGQMDAAKFVVLFAGNIMQAISNVIQMAKAISELGLATKILTAIEWVHNAAIAVKIGLLTLGVGLVAAAASIWWFMSQMQSMSAGMPSMQFGGPVRETGPYLLHAGEFVLPAGKTTSIIVNVYGAGSPRETGDAVIDALRRSGAI